MLIKERARLNYHLQWLSSIERVKKMDNHREENVTPAFFDSKQYHRSKKYQK